MKKSKYAGLIGWLIAAASSTLALWLVFTPPLTPPPGPLRVKVEQIREQPTPETEDQQLAMIVPPPVLPEHPFTLPPGHKPEIAIIIDDMGLNLSGSRRAVKLPRFVTLSYMPYAERLDEQTTAAHEEGHELLLHMPMEPIGREDPGPGALLVNLSADQVRARLDHALDSFGGFDGVNNHMGSKFTAYAPGMEIVVGELKKRGLFFLDSRTSAKSVGAEIARKDNLPTVTRDVFLDDSLAPEAIRAQLAATERVATRKGYAIAIGHPHEATLKALEEWLPDAEKRGFEFVAAHDLVNGPNQ